MESCYSGIVLGVLVTYACHALAVELPRVRPNIVVIVADDLVGNPGLFNLLIGSSQHLLYVKA